MQVRAFERYIPLNIGLLCQLIFESIVKSAARLQLFICCSVCEKGFIYVHGSLFNAPLIGSWGSVFGPC